ncbi:hypothetical protein [Nonomuraea jiangxiensis]|uniref:Uncharacterized protein n=1 Tax=Nonomuraea jiangxiensis TaxID=633440 RepID=A0A1G9EDM4_9ACTN|nr:hypothetical protein [Nonomuraea jiangxiensis]SDK74270.1 hypothetical protein SAMN05421869_118125 [Nonomuraea jiangxiensis]
MGRHEKPRSPKEQPPEGQEAASQEESPISRGKHAATVGAQDEK